MTLIFGGCSLLMVVVSLLFVGDVGALVSAKTRAQLAADAVALAAVAESAPHGRNTPDYMARRYAEANGARLVMCECKVGASSVEVEVEVEGTSARARAVLDARLLSIADLGSFEAGLHPLLADAVGTLLRAAGGTVRLSSGYRTPTRQAELWADALARYGSPEAARRWVAPPGGSMHERGLAVDLAGDLERAARLVTELGLPLHRPLAHEEWHFELLGSRY